jgi:hypothetical protein
MFKKQNADRRPSLFRRGHRDLLIVLFAQRAQDRCLTWWGRHDQ